MSMLTESDKIFLIQLSRSVIKAALEIGHQLPVPEDVSGAVFEKRGCFVTLHKEGLLRGCIGTIEPEKPLIECVEENAFNAAFRDPRFPSVTVEEISDIQIEVSVLTVPKKLEFRDAEDLKNQLNPGVHGVILSRGWQRSTFLPQVWEQLPDKETFLMHLCEKAGMKGNCWKKVDTQIEVYEALYFSE